MSSMEAELYHNCTVENIQGVNTLAIAAMEKVSIGRFERCFSRLKDELLEAETPFVAGIDG